MVTLLLSTFTAPAVYGQQENAPEYAGGKYFFTLHLVVPYVGPGAEADKAVAIKEDLAKIGINVKIHHMEKSSYYTRVWGAPKCYKTWDEGGWDMEIGRFSWVPFGAKWFEGCWASSGMPPAGWNYFSWNDAKADKALSEGLKCFDPKERKKHYSDFLYRFKRNPPAMAEYWPIIARPVTTDFDMVGTAKNYGITEKQLKKCPSMFLYNRNFTPVFAPFWDVKTDKLVCSQGTEPNNILPLFHSSGDDFNYGMSEPLIVGPAYNKPEQFGPDGPGVIPWLAENWEWGPGHKSITFNLRDNIYWQDGVPITAEDVKWTVDAILDPKTAAAAHSDYKKTIESVEVVDSKTVKFNLKKPSPYIMTLLVGPWEGAICPKHILKDVAHEDLKTHWMNVKGPTSEHPTYVGSGPFKLVEWKKGKYLKFKAWDNWWGWDVFGDGEPTVDKYVVKIIPDASTALSSAAAGEIDLMHSYQCLSVVTEIPEVAEGSDEISPYKYTMQTIRFIGFNLDHPILANKYVRKAICYAHNNQYVIDNILSGLGVPATGPIPKSHSLYPDNHPTPWSYDVTKAKNLMEKAGYKYEYLKAPGGGLPWYIPGITGFIIGLIVAFLISRYR